MSTRYKQTEETVTFRNPHKYTAYFNFSILKFIIQMTQNKSLYSHKTCKGPIYHSKEQFLIIMTFSYLQYF